MVWQYRQSFSDDTYVAISSRSPGDSEFGPRRRTSTRSLSGLAVSGRKAIGPRMPGRSEGRLIWGTFMTSLPRGPDISLARHALAHHIVRVRIFGERDVWHSGQSVAPPLPAAQYCERTSGPRRQPVDESLE